MLKHQLPTSRVNASHGAGPGCSTAPFAELVGQLPQPVVRPGSARPGSASIFRAQTPRGQQKKVPLNVGVAFPSDEAFADRQSQERQQVSAAPNELSADLKQMRFANVQVSQPAAAGRASGLESRRVAGTRTNATGGRTFEPVAAGLTHTQAAHHGRSRSNRSSIPGGIFG
jgi:hypothetical protein